MNNDQNNLLKKINAALYDDADPYQALRDCRAEIESLRQALAAPVEPVATIFFSGPIGYFWVDTLEMGERILHYMKVDDDDWTATNTAPPSVDALIAEAVATEREACAQLCDARWQYGNAVDCSQAIRARGQK